jgi:accessory gene regulator protein AgrB
MSFGGTFCSSASFQNAEKFNSNAIVDAPGNYGNASMPERRNPWKKKKIIIIIIIIIILIMMMMMMIMMMMMMMTTTTTTTTTTTLSFAVKATVTQIVRSQYSEI